MFSLRSSIRSGFGALAVLLALFSGPDSRAAIDGLSLDVGTVGTELGVPGSGYGTSVKAFLAQNGQKVRKTNLKVVSITGTDPNQTATLVVRKAFAGTFQIGIQPKGGAPFISDKTFTIAPPRIAQVGTALAAVGDSVTLLVEHAGNKRLQVFVHNRRAKITGTAPTPSAKPPAFRFTDVTFRVPKVPTGTHNITLRNSVGQDIAKAVLTVTGSNKAIGGPRAEMLVDGVKFKTRKHTSQLNVNGVCCRFTRGSSQRNRQLKVNVPFDPSTDTAPQTYTNPPALIEYVEVDGQNTERWTTSDLSTFQVIVNAFEPATCTLLLTVCGTLEAAAPNAARPTVEVEGTLVCKLPKPNGNGPNCNQEMDGHIDGVRFRADVTSAVALVGTTTTQFAGLDTPANQQIQFTLNYNAFQDGPKSFPGGTNILLFKLNDNGKDYFMSAQGQGGSVSIEILSNNGNCITGTFSGSVVDPNNLNDVLVFTKTFTFEVPLTIQNP